MWGFIGFGVWHPLHHRAPLGETDTGVLTALTPSWHWVGVSLWEAMGHRSGGGGAHSEVPETLEMALGSPGLQGGWCLLALRLLVTQTSLDGLEDLRMEWRTTSCINLGPREERVYVDPNEKRQSIFFNLP